MTIAILGAGLQGICAALALRERGHQIVLLEQDPEVMDRASYRNEGKIHLGFIYANDASFRTARLMLASAMQFAPLLDRWLPGHFRWDDLRSEPFTYLVMRDSLTDPDALFAHYQKISDSFTQGEASGEYLGMALGDLWRPIPVPQFVDANVVAAAVATDEVALDLTAFRHSLRAGMQSFPEIDVRCGLRIESVMRCSEGFAVHTIDADGAEHTIRADAVVNCLWDARLAVDRQLGMVSPRKRVYRLKYRVLAELPAPLREIPPLSLVLGQYGDVVPWTSGSYLSWYPACRRGWATTLSPPPEWGPLCRGEVSPDVAAGVATETLAALDDVIPGVAMARVTGVDAGVVVAWGDSDIDRPDSELHERHAVGVHAEDGYFSIDTGKLVCAPYFAEQLATHL